MGRGWKIQSASDEATFVDLVMVVREYPSMTSLSKWSMKGDQ